MTVVFLWLRFHHSVTERPGIMVTCCFDFVIFLQPIVGTWKCLSLLFWLLSFLTWDLIILLLQFQNTSWLATNNICCLAAHVAFTCNSIKGRKSASLEDAGYN